MLRILCVFKSVLEGLLVFKRILDILKGLIRILTVVCVFKGCAKSTGTLKTSRVTYDLLQSNVSKYSGPVTLLTTHETEGKSQNKESA